MPARSRQLRISARKGAVALDDTQLKDLIVGKTVSVRNTVTGAAISASLRYRRASLDFERWTESASTSQKCGDVLHSGELGSPPVRDPGWTAHHNARGHTLRSDGLQHRAITTRRHAATNSATPIRNNPTPQIVMNPLTAMMNQFSIEVGLTEQQKQQIVPFLKQEAPKLEALKKKSLLVHCRRWSS